ncbi:MAG: malic enzyme-like NAD(P)-binding protein [Bacilli bacterium]
MKEEALKIHENGKISISSRIKLDDAHDLSLAYSPGVAYPCLEIQKDPDKSYLYTSKGHMVLIISDGTAVLGLGDIGPRAALPVLEGKALLLKKFADIDCFPICLDTKDPEKIIETVKIIAPTCGAIILEDISAPRCVTIERRLKEELDIPVFHDDQHGTAIVVGAGLINASKLINKPINEMNVAVSGAGAAGSSVMRLLKSLGVKNIYATNAKGVIDFNSYEKQNFIIKELLDEKIISSPINHDNTLSSIMKNADVFVGLSAPGIVTKEMIQTMAENPIVFALANPIPEIMPEEAIKGGAKIIATGRSDYPNQINNVLAFPGIFKGALACRTKKITEEMKLAAAFAIAGVIAREELTENYIIPNPFDLRVVEAVSKAIINEEIKK